MKKGKIKHLEDKAFYSSRELAEHFGISPQTILDLIHKEYLKAVRIGHQYRVPWNEVMRLYSDLSEFSEGES